MDEQIQEPVQQHANRNLRTRFFLLRATLAIVSCLIIYEAIAITYSPHLDLKTNALKYGLSIDEEPIGLKFIHETLGEWYTRRRSRHSAIYPTDPGVNVTFESSDVQSSIESITTLRHIDLSFSDVDDASLSRFRSLPIVEVLDLSNTRISDASASVLGRCTNLQSIWLSRTGISNRTLSSLPISSNLRTVVVDHTSVTDDGLDSLLKCSNLEVLDLTGTGVTTEGVRKILHKLPIRKLYVSDTKVDERVFEEAGACKTLELLEVYSRSFLEGSVQELEFRRRHPWVVVK